MSCFVVYLSEFLNSIGLQVKGFTDSQPVVVSALKLLDCVMLYASVEFNWS